MSHIHGVNISITLRNASFGETDSERAEELVRMLKAIAVRIGREGLEDLGVMDANGNRVGSVQFS